MKVHLFGSGDEGGRRMRERRSGWMEGSSFFSQVQRNK